MSKSATSPLQDNSSLGPMEETTLDFENLVLGKKKSPPTSTSPFQSRTLQPTSPFNNTSMASLQPTPSFNGTSMATLQPSNTFTSNSMPTTPVGMGIMAPMQPSQTPPPPPSGTFFPPLQSSPYAAPIRNELFNSPNPVYTTNNTNQYGANPWSTNTSSANVSFPTLAPPPNKASSASPGLAMGQGKGTGSGLDKYQSLL